MLSHAQLFEVHRLLERLDDLVHHLAQIVAALQPDALHPARPHVVDQDPRELGHFFFVRFHVSTRSMQPLLLAGKEDEADRAFGLHTHGLQGPCGLEHGHDPCSVVGGACAQVPAIDVAADQDDLVGFVGTRELGDRVVDLDLAGD